MPRTTLRARATLAALTLALTGLVPSAAAGSTASVTVAHLEPRAATVQPAAAAPGTLVFIKNFNVWMSRGDGSGQVQVTKDATSESNRYKTPSMSDDGIITVLRGTDVVRLRTDGTRLSTFDVGTLLPEPYGGIQGTTGVHVSPNGANVAFTQTAWRGPGYSVEVGTRFSASNRWNMVGQQEMSRSDAKWITNSRVIMRSWGTTYLRDMSSNTSVKWFDDEDVRGQLPGCEDWCYSEEQWEPELSRDGAHLVSMRGPTNDPTMLVYQVTGNARTSVPAPPQIRCAFDGGDDEFGHPTIGPDNKALAWQMSQGIYVKTNLTSCATSDVRLAVPGGSEPSWSAAAYKAPTPPKSTKKITVTKAPKISGTAKVGKKLKATKGSFKPAPSKITYQWKRNGKAIKKATKSTYKLTKSDAGKKITVTVTATRSGYTKAAKTSKAVAVAAYNTKKPKIKKKPAARVGKTLKVSKGTWKGKPKVSYQWYRGSKKIKGATKSKYKVTRADRGKKLRVKVTAKRSGAPKVSVWSARTAKVR